LHPRVHLGTNDPVHVLRGVPIGARHGQLLLGLRLVEVRRRRLVPELELLRRRRAGALSRLSPSSSSSPNRASFAPCRAPLVLLEAPPSVIPSISSGSPWVSVAMRSSRFTA